MNERRRLQRYIRALTGEVPVRHLVQFIIDQRDEVVQQVNAQAGKKISEDDASLLIDDATAIREGIGC